MALPAGRLQRNTDGDEDLPFGRLLASAEALALASDPPHVPPARRCRKTQSPQRLRPARSRHIESVHRACAIRCRHAAPGHRDRLLHRQRRGAGPSTSKQTQPQTTSGAPRQSPSWTPGDSPLPQRMASPSGSHAQSPWLGDRDTWTRTSSAKSPTALLTSLSQSCKLSPNTRSHFPRIS